MFSSLERRADSRRSYIRKERPEDAAWAIFVNLTVEYGAAWWREWLEFQPHSKKAPGFTENEWDFYFWNCDMV